MEVIIGTLLRAGVVAAAVVVLAGAAVYLVRHGAAAPHYAVFQGEPTDLRTPSGILADAATLQGRGIIQLGLLILLATPVARVAFSVFAFAMERDSLYVVVTLIVLAVLVLSLAGGML
ncbi:MAG: DUF1634 domain-containing protein [Acidobacteriia bacterium]|nr:DUF1634 domain-containing protein [Terriglobia bacterium]